MDERYLTDTPPTDVEDLKNDIKMLVIKHGLQSAVFGLHLKEGNYLVGNNLPDGEGSAPLTEMLTLQMRNSAQILKEVGVEDRKPKTHAFLTLTSPNHFFIKDRGSYEGMMALLNEHKRACAVVEIREIKNITW